MENDDTFIKENVKRINELYEALIPIRAFIIRNPYNGLKNDFKRLHDNIIHELSELKEQTMSKVYEAYLETERTMSEQEIQEAFEDIEKDKISKEDGALSLLGEVWLQIQRHPSLTADLIERISKYLKSK